MKMLDIFRFSISRILRGGRKVFLSILAIAVGIFAVCLISGAGDLAAQEIQLRVSETGLGGITIFPVKNGQGSIGSEQLDRLTENISGLKAATPFSMQTATLSFRGKNRNSALIGVNEQITEVFQLRLLFGRFFTKADLASGQPVVVIDDALAQTLYERRNIVGKELSFYIDGVRLKARIIGIIASQKQGLEGMMGISLPNLVYIPHTVLAQITGSGDAGQIAISCFEPEQENRVAEETVRYLQLENQTNYKYENLNQYLSSLQEIVEILRLFIQVVAGISLVVGGIGIMNSMLYTVDARRTEIGICKALGEPQSSILLRYLTEAILLCSLGGLLGLTAALGTAALMEHWIGIHLSIRLSGIVHSCTLALLCGIFSGILPAYSASALDPIDVIQQ